MNGDQDTMTNMVYSLNTKENGTAMKPKLFTALRKNF